MIAADCAEGYVVWTMEPETAVRLAEELAELGGWANEVRELRLATREIDD